MKHLQPNMQKNNSCHLLKKIQRTETGNTNSRIVDLAKLSLRLVKFDQLKITRVKLK